jgi:large conductance mechanosensitive channel
MSFISEFKSFALRGSVLDLAIGVVIGSAFGKIVDSLVNDIVTPAILTPALTAANLKNLAELTIPGTAIKYGSFLSAIISFLIVAAVLFLIVKAMNKMQKNQDQQPAEPSVSEKLLMEIRDELKERKP